jgi:hypothetical protein
MLHHLRSRLELSNTEVDRHRRLLGTYCLSAGLGGEPPTLTTTNDEYFWKHLTWHCMGANDIDLLLRIVKDAKLIHGYYAINYLLDALDLSHRLRPEDRKKVYEAAKDKASDFGDMRTRDDARIDVARRWVAVEPEAELRSVLADVDWYSRYGRQFGILAVPLARMKPERAVECLGFLNDVAPKEGPAPAFREAILSLTTALSAEGANDAVKRIASLVPFPVTENLNS